MRKVLFFFFSFFLFAGSVFSQAVPYTQKVDASEILSQRGEVYFSFEIYDPKELVTLTRIISIDKLEGQKVCAYANRSEFDKFLALNINYTLLIPPSEIVKVKMMGFEGLRGTQDWDFYPTYDAYLLMMNQFVEDYPGLCRVVEIGTLQSGRKLLSLVISDNVNEHEAEPQFLYTSSMHGDETTGYPLMLRFIDYLLSNYGTDPRVTNLVNEIEIHINPLANPDGTYAGGNHTVNGSTRGNANYVDLNRNYPDPEDGPHPDGNAWQEETILFMEYADNNDFVMSANFHGGAELLNYPWDTWVTRHADDNWWIYVCYEYVDTVHAHSSGYMYGQGTGVTNGYDWYSISGGRQDYMTYFANGRECTIEISDIKTLPPSQLPAHWEYNYRSFLNWLEQCHYGVQGLVTDAESGDPIRSRITIEGHDIDSSHIYSTIDVGNYNRLLYEGEYDITYNAMGYFPQTITVNVINNETTYQDVVLQAGDLIADFTSNKTTVASGENVMFYDQSYGNIVSWEWTFEGGSPASSNLQNPIVSYSTPGDYTVSLTVSDGIESNTIERAAYISVNLEYLMSNSTISTNNGLFYDSGGADNNYSDNENYIMTFKPSGGCTNLRIEFIEFNVEYESSCDYDWLRIYNGLSTESPLIGTYCGTNSPGVVIADNDYGAITFQFHSDGGVSMPGWVADISCESYVGLNQLQGQKMMRIFPNPATDILSIIPENIHSEEIRIILYDLTGKTIIEQTISTNSTTSIETSSWKRGIYFIEFRSESMRQTERIILQ